MAAAVAPLRIGGIRYRNLPRNQSTIVAEERRILRYIPRVIASIYSPLLRLSLTRYWNKIETSMVEGKLWKSLELWLNDLGGYSMPRLVLNGLIKKIYLYRRPPHIPFM